MKINISFHENKCVEVVVRVGLEIVLVFLKCCLTTFKAYLSNTIRYEKHLLSHVLIGLRWMLVKVGVKFFKAFNDVIDEVGIIF